MPWPPLARSSQSEELETIYVYGRVPVPEPRVAASVVSFDAASIAAELVGDARDLVRYTPGLAVRNDPHRFGLDSFAIRGLGGNRVAVEVDGMPAAPGFAVGSYSDSGRSFVDTALIERVEILRGPASALYGSDAIAGVVSARTVDAARLLGGADTALSLRSGYTGADGGWNAALLGAARVGAVDGFVGYVRREGQELDSAADDIEPNPRDYASDALLLKLEAAGVPGGPLRLWLYAQQIQQQTSVDSYLLTPGRFANTTELLGDDRQDLQRATLTQTIDEPGLARPRRLGPVLATHGDRAGQPGATPRRAAAHAATADRPQLRTRLGDRGPAHDRRAAADVRDLTPRPGLRPGRAAHRHPRDARRTADQPADRCEHVHRARRNVSGARLPADHRDPHRRSSCRTRSASRARRGR